MNRGKALRVGRTLFSTHSIEQLNMTNSHLWHEHYTEVLFRFIIMISQWGSLALIVHPFTLRFPSCPVGHDQEMLLVQSFAAFLLPVLHLSALFTVILAFNSMGISSRKELLSNRLFSLFSFTAFELASSTPRPSLDLFNEQTPLSRISYSRFQSRLLKIPAYT